MADTRLILTDNAIKALPYAVSGQYFARDSELPGFAVLVGKRQKTFIIQGDLRADGKRISLRIKIANFGIFSTREARAAAKELLGKIAKGEDPREKAPEPEIPKIVKTDPTLREAWDRYHEAHMQRKGRSQKTSNGYRDHIERLLADWLDQPLSKLGENPALVMKRHDDITSANGPYMANGCMRSLRAIYNHARKTFRSLPVENPVSAVDWNPEKRRDTGMGLSDLPAWFDQLSKIDNPIRREFHLCLLLSGCRPDALKNARVEHVNFRTRVLHIPKPKGGEIKAFDIPLSRALVKCLVRVIRLGRALYPVQSQDWLFPGESLSGHLVEHKENREILSKWGNELRQTYRTIAQTASIADLDVHLLMNHSVANVNAGYITRSRLLSDHLRRQQEIISRKILDTPGGNPKAHLAVTPKWPFRPANRVIEDLLKTSS